MEELKKSRKSLKARLTRISNWFSINKDCETIDLLLEKQSQLALHFSEYEKIQQQIEGLDDSELDSQESIEFEEKYTNTLVNIKIQIKALSNNILDYSKNTPIEHISKGTVKLPEISMQTFEGNFEDWNSFFQLFCTLVIDNSQLNDLQRFIYLKSFLRREPLELIKNIEVVNDNFQIALDTLKERYDNKPRIVSLLIKRLLKVSSLAKCTSQTLRNFITQAKQNIMALNNLEVPTQYWDLILIEIFLEKLDYNTHKAFEYEVGTKSLPTLKQFFEFLENRCNILEKLNCSETQQKGFKYSQKVTHFSSSDNKVNSNKLNCSFCNHSMHNIYQCEKFKASSLSDRNNFVKLKHLCKNCLGSKHFVANCTSQRTCNICNKKHHSLLHSANTSMVSSISRSQVPSSNSHAQNSQPSQGTSSDNHMPSVSQRSAHSLQPQTSCMSDTTQTFTALSIKNEVLLATALVTLYTKEHQPIRARCLLDNASQTSFITQELVNKLKLSPYTRTLEISTLSQNCSVSNKMVDLKIFSLYDCKKGFMTSCAVLKNITCRLPQVPIDRTKIKLPEWVQLADPSYSVPGKIDMLLGSDVYGKLLLNDLIQLGDGLPTLQNTHFGYVMFGQVPVRPHSKNNLNLCTLHDKSQILSTSNSQHVSLFTQSLSDDSIDNKLQKFWEIEEIPDKTILTPQENLAEQIFKNTTQILPDGRFQVDIPLISKDAPTQLGDSFYMAKKRFLSLENKLVKNNELYTQYKNFISEYISLSHARVVPLSLLNSDSGKKYFLPHHCVLKEDSLTTKLRVVFDGSMKTTTQVSLNDLMLKGYRTQPELFDILIRFRTYKFALTADIQKMFRQIKINPDQTFLLNILWRDSPQEELQCLELQTVTYGTKSAPFLSTRCLMELAHVHKNSYPLASDALLNSCYVDDILFGSETLDGLFKAHNEISELLKKACISLHKWCSNSKEFLTNITNKSQIASYTISPEKIASNKVLGLRWDAQTDSFSISIPKIMVKTSFTKREVLSTIAQIFDPQGLIAPVTIIAKIIMQKIWLSKVNWDDALTSELQSEWIVFVSNIPFLKNINIPRPLFRTDPDKIIKIEIHAFSDASIRAYATCVYIRVMDQSKKVSCTLVASKSRVAPLKTLTLPRLELMGAVLCSKLTQRLITTLNSTSMHINSINLWSDSEIVLAWLKSHPSRWSQFVANRVAQIQEISSGFHWRYVKSKENPADILSRGLIPSELVNSHLWWHGPQWLGKYDLTLDSCDKGMTCSNPPEERRLSHMQTQQYPIENFCCSMSNKFSNFSTFQRTLAYCFRFIHNATISSVTRYGPLSVSELHSSEQKIITFLQLVYFSQEISELKSGKTLSNKSLLSLNVFLDDKEMLRVGGRLKHAHVPFDQKYPLLLPSKHHIVQLMLKREHIRLCHSGAQTTLSNFRLKYWPLNGLRTIKKIIHSCITCFRFRAQPASQLMADLPKERLVVSHPFTNVGTDFGGPFFIKSSRLRKAPVTKCYIAIFVCMVTRAVHIELVSGLSTEAFILTLKRFISRRGNPKIIYSDNASNFFGAKNQLKEFSTFLKNKETSNSIQNFLAASEISWKFIPPRSPHHGGLWEAAIKSTKYHIFRLIGNSQLTFEEFSTVLAQIEAVLNSRPLCSLSNDPSDLSCLTPGHFLIGKPLTSFPERDVSDISENRLSIWQRSTKIQQLFWKRWTVDYLNRLQNRPKWTSTKENLQLNDLVLLKDENNPPLKWPLARVIEVFPGSNKRVRVVKVQTKDGIFTRSIAKLCPLPDYKR
ncbi:uncharacterized protein [Diabrotica undecimpunctata]|uniref:uncharacterized protein n=1 Tax=Diabrotica undecimpunctata TaxID=50387 RepID=UPI003B63C351